MRPTTPDPQRGARRTKPFRVAVATTLALAGSSAVLLASLPQQQAVAAPTQNGQRIFRFDTFGDEQFWTDVLQMNQVVESSVDPLTALAVGLKVDADALPPGILDSADLTSPATTVALLKLNAVVGVQATVDVDNHITRLGVTCALCHSTVDDAVAPGIGQRRDGWPKPDQEPGR